MTLDKEEHRAILLQVLDSATFGGALRDVIYEIGQALKNAAVEPPEDRAA